MDSLIITEDFVRGIGYGVCGTILTMVILRVLGVAIMLLEWRAEKKNRLKPEEMLKNAKFKFGQKVYFVSLKYSKDGSKRIQYIQSAIVGDMSVEKENPPQIEYDLFTPENFRLKKYKFRTGDYKPPEWCLASSKEELLKQIREA